jgi:hypothetical protein
MVALPWSCLPIVTKKSYNKEIFLSTPPNIVTLNWATVLYKKMKELSSALHTQTIPLRHNWTHHKRTPKISSGLNESWKRYMSKNVTEITLNTMWIPYNGYRLLHTWIYSPLMHRATIITKYKSMSTSYSFTLI